MQLTLLPGYPDLIGRRFAWVANGNGPASYVQGGDPTQLPTSHTYIDTITSDVPSISGNYTVIAAQSYAGQRPTWKIKWIYAGGQLGVDGIQQNVAGSGMTPGLVTPLTFSTGNASGTFTVLTATTGYITITSAGSGYVTPPTVTTSGTGGTPPTFNNVSIGLANGSEVAATTNLSAEIVQIAGFGGEY